MRSLDNRLRRQAGHRARDFRQELGNDKWRREMFVEWEAAEEIECLKSAVGLLEEYEQWFKDNAGALASHGLGGFAFENPIDHSTTTSTVSTRLDPDPSICPECGGPADNGHDCSVPPNPYFCTKCSP